MTEYGLKTSPEEIDVKTAGPLDLLYSSEWNNWKIFAEGTKNFTVPLGSSDYTDITHALGYVPAAEIQVICNGYACKVPGPDINVDYQFDAYIDNAKIRVYGIDAGSVGAVTVTVQYKIYYEKLGD